ncbi:glycoside hydrolase family 127 protein [bacterium]|nr:glycoside hydrolase family 127 protein [bacterium]
MKARFVFSALCILTAGSLAAGEWTDRFRLTLDRVIAGGPPPYSRELILADVIPAAGRRFTEYSGDVSGRWLDALASCSGLSEKAGKKVKALLPDILAMQKPDGHFGADLDPKIINGPFMAMLWGNGRLLIGLLEVHRVFPGSGALAAARRIGDYLVRIAPDLNTETARIKLEEEFASGYICWTHNIEGLAGLSAATGDKTYLKLAGSIAGRVRMEPGQHSHGYLSSLRGILDLYRLTGDKKYLRTVETGCRDILDSGNLLLQGAVPEAFKPEMKRTEGCTEADWLRLNLVLWQATENPEYADRAERTLFNEFAMNQFDTGDFGHRVLSADGVASGTGGEGAGTARAWWCCTLHGLRCFPEIFRHAFRAGRDGLTYDFPVDGSGTKGKWILQAESNLGKDGSVILKSVSASKKTEWLWVRKPAWAGDVRIFIGEEEQSLKPQGLYAGIQRLWKEGDEIRISYEMRTRIEAEKETGRISFFHGPWLLGVDEEASPFFFDEPYSLNRIPFDATKSASTIPEASNAGSENPFGVPAARFELPYLPGGYPMLPMKALLRPPAEQTGFRSAAWIFYFVLKQSEQDRGVIQ